MQLFKNKTLIACILAVLVGVIMIILAAGNVFKSWQLFFADALYDGNNPSNQIVMVYVDQKTINPDSLGEYSNWNRSNFAQVLNNINKYEPKVVAFDFFFRTSKDEETDKAFQEALSATKNPVIMYPGNPQTFDGKKGYYVNPKDQKEVILPNEIFRNITNITLSLGNAIKDDDGLMRRIAPIIYDEKLQKYDENLAFAIARKTLGGTDLPATPPVKKSTYEIQQNNGKSLSIPLEDGQMLINFSSRTKENPMQSISFFDVYNEKYQDFQNNPEQLFKDKIVIIGPKANFFNDLYVTPVSKEAWMPGAELQANALQTILEQKFLRNLTLTEKSVLIVVLALAAAFIFMFTKIRWSVIALAVFIAGYSIAAKPLFNAGIILDLVHPYLTVVITFVAVYMYRYLTEFKQKNALQSAFGKYVNPTLARQIAEHPESLKLGGEKREVTVLFTDIVHFTTISEKLKPESLVALLNEYFEAMSAVIMAEGGTVDKFEGDAIMAFFGAPVGQPDHALRAARAAINMRIKLNELLASWKSPDHAILPGGEPKPSIDFRCGLSSGEVIVGNIGSSSRFNYTVMGDIVNLGSRLEGANKKYTTHIMMSEKTHTAIRDQFETRELDVIQVVGKTEPIKIFELLAPKGQLPAEAITLLQQYGEAMALYHNRQFADALTKFSEILKSYPGDGPTQLYRQRCEVLRDFPPKEDWNGVFEMGSK